MGAGEAADKIGFGELRGLIREMLITCTVLGLVLFSSNRNARGGTSVDPAESVTWSRRPT